MLPRANTRFTGRGDQLASLDRLLDDAEGAAGLAVVTGMGGVGKTALARWREAEAVYTEYSARCELASVRTKLARGPARRHAAPAGTG
ncbi:ATP-binding protein [Glycomyces sp. TRM65418]|uniref:AAA family ATPase n=1 Tax=Glycomyces sp. TRM65418 TaxID=2867006 RepID=UPI001CE703A7|nr:ATP-binding protein [Glycomyces sp. TRM65418]MCC3764668.1 ATP-binding protein [Glycomyces sp. TRM65418]QZD54328.1 ATP-binding protein [Glycomyces sp. TRM65418]